LPLKSEVQARDLGIFAFFSSDQETGQRPDGGAQQQAATQQCFICSPPVTFHLSS